MPEPKEFLATRRSMPIPSLRAPAPTGRELDEILRIASRVPDHGKLAPWRFILIHGDAAGAFGRAMTQILQSRDAQPLSEARRTYEEERFTRAPLVICVVSTARPHFKIPEWEQVLSAGAATMNLINAVHASGYAANWITEWPAYDDDAKTVLGIKPDEKVVGFIYIGTPSEPPSERPRPDLADIVSEARVPADVA